MTDTPNLPAERKPQLHTGASVAALVPQTLDEAYRLADAMSRSGLTPNGIKTPEAVMVAIMAGAELGLPPFQACQSFAIVNGRPSLWGDSIPALLWANGFKIKEWLDGASDDGDLFLVHLHSVQDHTPRWRGNRGRVFGGGREERWPLEQDRPMANIA